MSYGWRLVVLGLASFSAAGLVGSACVPWLAPRIRARSARGRVIALMRLRLLPGAFGLAALGLAVTSFLTFEPRAGQAEPTGVVLRVLALGAATLLTTSIIRLARIGRGTRDFLDRWQPVAERVDLPEVGVPAFAIDAAFPIVAVVGLRRPVLFIARSVLKACTSDQLRVVLAHERRHVAHRDNLRHILLACLPDVLNWTRAGRVLDAAWHDTVEEAADDEAGAAAPDGRLHLAQALIQVARLAPPGSRRELSVSAFYRGESIARRVHRLLAEPDAVVDEPPSRLRGLLASGAGVAASALALHAIHELMEAALKLLP